MPEAAEGGDHLVGREQDVVAVADLAHAAPVALGGRERAARVLHRLHVHEAHGLRPHREDRLLELVEEEARELLLGLLGRAVVAVRVGDVPHLGDERLERRPDRGDAVDRERAERRPVVGDVAGDRLVAMRRRRAAAATMLVVRGSPAPRAPLRPRTCRRAPRSTGARASRPTRPPRSRRSRRTRGSGHPARARRPRPRARSRAGARTTSSYRRAARASARAPPARSPRRTSSRCSPRRARRARPGSASRSRPRGGSRRRGR